MRLEDKIKLDDGFLLMECLVTLSIITVILLFIYPLLVDWIVLQNLKGTEVELSRELYQQAAEWPKDSITTGNYRVVKDSQKLFVYNNDQTIRIEIYEKQFKE